MFKKDFFVGLSVGIAIPLAMKIISIINTGRKKTKQYKGKIFIGIQLGGTNFNVAIAEPVINNLGQITNFRILKKKNGITYDDPEQSIQSIINFIRESAVKSQINKQIQIQFIGIASFGPLCLDKTSQLYGSITSTPKLLWRGQKVLDKIKNAFIGTQVQIDTDVNAAAYAQFTLGGHLIKESLVYITVGTGVGVGVISHGKTVHGLTHPQGGHIIVQRHPQQYENYKGVCPYHKEQTCLESMVTNLSIAKRLNIDFTKLADVGDDQKVWRLVGFYLAQLCLNVTLLISPQVIVIGGGIMNRKILFPIIHKQFVRLLSKYVDHPLLEKGNIADYIKSPSLGENVGVIGAMMLSTLNK